MRRIRQSEKTTEGRRRNPALLLLFAAGFLLVLYPVVGNLWNSYRQHRLANTYETAVESLDEDQYEELWEEAREYNASHTPYSVPDAFAVSEVLAEEEDEEYLVYESLLNVAGDGIMGYVEIPKIDIKIPIYHGTEDEVLAKGAGHLYGSSLPVGGEGTHAVIAAHRGLPSAPLFTDLDLLEEGDQFYLYILDDILAYEVDQILVVEPEETESLVQTPGEDYVTLVTCTPYGVNTQRLLVRGHRVEYTAERYEEEAKKKTSSLVTNYVLVALLGFLIVAVAAVLIRMYYRRKAAAAGNSDSLTGKDGDFAGDRDDSTGKDEDSAGDSAALTGKGEDSAGDRETLTGKDEDSAEDR
ncbi:MAG: class C sortase [Lachnospiraceae bacterium]|nr:class C sortase [Lachnospiraceae bacterium]